MKPTVSKITVARLFNLGNYEHARIEVTLNLEDQDVMFVAGEAVKAMDPGDILRELQETIEALRPEEAGSVQSYALDVEFLKTAPGTNDDWEERSRPERQMRVDAFNARAELRTRALERLNQLGAEY